jgi:hypothetical protein
MAYVPKMRPMAYVPKMRHDVFICHAHNDDDPRGSGWVSKFRADLRKNLRDRLGEVDVFMDDKLSPDEKYRSKLEEEVRKTAVFVPVLSPSLLRSSFCYDEFKWFMASLDRSSAGVHDSLIFKIVLLPDLQGMHHFWPRGITPIDFYSCENEINIALQREHPKYTAQLEYLGAKIAARLEDLRTQFDPVFVAYVSKLSLDNELKKLLSELFSDGHPTLPGVYIPNFSEARDQLADQIEDSKYCVFLLGEEYNSEISDLVEIARDKKKRCIFWIGTKELREITPEQKNFIRRIESKGLELYRGNLASQIYERLKPASALTCSEDDLQAPKTSDTIRLYVISDKQGSSREKASEIVRQIETENSRQSEPIKLLPFEPVLPPETPPSLFRRRHDEILRSCDAVVVYWERGDKDWLRDTWREVSDRKLDGEAEYKSAVIFSPEPLDDNSRSKVIESLKVQDEVIGRPTTAPQYSSSSPGAVSDIEGSTTDRQFDPAKLRRFLTSLIGS